jgi:hypothetical protein
MRLPLVPMAPLVMLAAILAITMAGCFLPPSPCQSSDTYCEGDTAHSCTTIEGEAHHSTTKCDATTEACRNGSCFTLTDVPCDPAGDACDPSGRSAYTVCAKGVYIFETPCSDVERCAVAPNPLSGKNYAACAITPFEPCATPGLAFCRDNLVLYCDKWLGLLTIEYDCNPDATCQSTATNAWCS